MDEKMDEIMKAIFDDLTDEQKEKAKQCKTMDELMALAGEWGIELPDEALDHVNGGCVGGESPCGEHDPCARYDECPRDSGDIQCAHIY